MYNQQAENPARELQQTNNKMMYITCPYVKILHIMASTVTSGFVLSLNKF